MHLIANYFPPSTHFVLFYFINGTEDATILKRYLFYSDILYDEIA